MQGILRQQVARAFQRLRSERNIAVEADVDAMELLLRSELIDRRFGGRPVRRVVEKYLLTPVAELVVGQRIQNDEVIRIKALTTSAAAIDLDDNSVGSFNDEDTESAKGGLGFYKQLAHATFHPEAAFCAMNKRNPDATMLVGGVDCPTAASDEQLLMRINVV